MDKQRNEQLKDVAVKVIDSRTAKRYTLANHYMKTFPNPKVCFGVFYKGRLSGVLSFGLSTATAEKVRKIIPQIADNEFIEMQRMHISDILGHNAESFVLGQIYNLFKQRTKVKAIITHAGGCKNDCGIVYQSSSWLYFGSEKCDDFYLTAKGEYKNIVAPMRFGRVPKNVKGAENVGRFLFGAGNLIHSKRYFYLYPLNRGLRAYLQPKGMAYPKDSTDFRKGQQWVK